MLKPVQRRSTRIVEPLIVVIAAGSALWLATRAGSGRDLVVILRWLLTAFRTSIELVRAVLAELETLATSAKLIPAVTVRAP